HRSADVSISTPSATGGGTSRASRLECGAGTDTQLHGAAMIPQAAPSLREGGSHGPRPGEGEADQGCSEAEVLLPVDRFRAPAAGAVSLVALQRRSPRGRPLRAGLF